MELLVAERNLASCSVHLEDDEVIAFADCEDCARIGDLVPAEFGDVCEAIKALYADKCTKCCKSLNFAVDDIVNVNAVPEFVFFCLLFSFEIFLC